MSKASYSYPPDEFDAPPDPDSPRGVHRAPRSAWSRWWPFVAVIVIVPLVAWAAVTYLAGKGQLPDIPGVASTSTAQATTGPTDAASAQATAPAAPTTTAAPAVELGTPVSVLNGSKIAGLAKKVGDQLGAVGFTKVTAGNATSSTPTGTVQSAVNAYVARTHPSSPTSAPSRPKCGMTGVDLDGVADVRRQTRWALTSESW